MDQAVRTAFRDLRSENRNNGKKIRARGSNRFSMTDTMDQVRFRFPDIALINPGKTERKSGPGVRGGGVVHPGCAAGRMTGMKGGKNRGKFVNFLYTAWQRMLPWPVSGRPAL